MNLFYKFKKNSSDGERIKIMKKIRERAWKFWGLGEWEDSDDGNRLWVGENELIPER